MRPLSRKWRLATAMMLLGFLALAPAMGQVLGDDRPDFDSACEAGTPYLVTACYSGLARQQQTSVSDPDAPSVVLFTDTPDDKPQYQLAAFGQTGSVWGLAYRAADRAIYAAAFHKRQLPFGPGGPGAVYRIDLATGGVTHFLTVPNTGPDRHTRPDTKDRGGEVWAGRTSLGDLDLTGDESELLVMNLDDGHVYRFEMPSGVLLGSFPHGASKSTWQDEARPFGLGTKQNILYHGVVRTAEETLNRRHLAAHVYRSRTDGSEMVEAAAVPLDYQRGHSRNAVGAKDVDLAWQPWRDGHPGLNTRWPTFSIYPMPLLSDIAIARDGSMILAFRDRRSDASKLYDKDWGPNVSELRLGLGFGDVLRGDPAGQRWLFDAADEFFEDQSATVGDESALGGVAVVPAHDSIIAGSYVENPQERWREGGYWYDSLTGDKVRHERLCDPRELEPYELGLHVVNPVHADDEYGSKVMRGPGTVGDVEALCRPMAPPTPTATTTPTSTRTQAPTATSSVVPSPTTASTATPQPTPTPTPEPLPLHLPLLLRERCTPDKQRADVALVIDASTSMRDHTSAGRTKLSAAINAAGIFLDLLQLDNGDQASITAFNEDARLLHPLTADRRVLNEALDSIEPARQTCLVCGVDVAADELASERRDPDNAPVMIVLTDGMSNPRPAVEAVNRAQEAKLAGVVVYTIGLGDTLDFEALGQIASEPGHFYHAPDPEDLSEIYRQIAVELPCPAGAFWGRR